jgi:hypothetical protein
LWGPKKCVTTSIIPSISSFEGVVEGREADREGRDNSMREKRSQADSQEEIVTSI